MRDLLLNVAQEYYLGQLANIRVISLRRLLEKMRPIMTRRLLSRDKVVPGVVGIDLTDEQGLSERMRLTLDTSGVNVDSDPADLCVKVDSLQLVRLLFGLQGPSRWCPWLGNQTASLLDQVFPLDLYVFKMDHV